MYVPPYRESLTEFLSELDYFDSSFPRRLRQILVVRKNETIKKLKDHALKLFKEKSWPSLDVAVEEIFPQLELLPEYKSFPVKPSTIKYWIYLSK